MAYWDTSCLAKLYVPEIDSASFQSYLVGSADNAVVRTSEISRFELWAVFRRKEANGYLQSGGALQAIQAFDADVAAALIVMDSIDSAIITKFEVIVEQCYSRTPIQSLRTLDGIHLATAALSGESEIVATDKRLREVGMSLGFSLYPPP